MNRVPKTPAPGLGAPDPDAPFRKLVEGVRDYAIFLIDPEGYVQTWNEGAQRIKEYAAHEIILGIGLTLARRIIALHGGEITAKSPGIGKGAEFTVSLPLLR